MELIGIIAFIWVAWAIIAGIIGKHKQNIRNQIAHEVLDINFDCSKEKEEIMSIKERLISVKEKIKFLTPNINFETDSRNNYPVYERIFCPTCKEGKLTKRRGSYGYFLGCSNYPKCRFTKNIH